MAGSFNHFPQIAAKVKPAVQKIVTETAIGVEEDMRSHAPERTGFLASSIYSVTPGYGSTYGEALAPPGDSYLLPEAQPDIVGVAANYGIYVELGTRFMAAQPYFYPAVEAGRAYLDNVDLEALLRV
jgi:hypothetical protein